MQPRSGLPAAVALAFLAFLAAPATGHAAPTSRQKIASMQYLVGTWRCAHTVGTFSGTYTTTYANALGNLWLRQTYDFPPRQLQENQEAEHAEAIFGYDEGRQTWVRFLALSTGQYFAMRMTDAGDGGWSWKYVSFFPRKTAETPGSDATFAKKSDAEYVIDGPTYPENGTLVTEHHVCKKQ